MDEFANNEINKCNFLLNDKLKNIELKLVDVNKISKINTEK